jgi:ATP-dependent DNA helicase RecG
MAPTKVFGEQYNDGNLSNLIIIGADRFGLASLHQMRGRVGRKGQPSNVYLVNFSGEEKERLNCIVKESDGDKLAEVDLSLRGFGELFGVQQTGKYLVDLDRLSDVGFDKLRIAVEDLMSNIGSNEKEKLLLQLTQREDYQA